MKRIITAMGNTTLNNELKKYSEYDLNENDLFYQDAVIDVVTTENIDILVVSGLLQGQFEFLDFIDKIQKYNNTIRIIVVMDEINTSVERKLKERGIVDIFLDENVQILDIIDAINREEPIIKKAEQVKEEISRYEKEHLHDKNQIEYVKEKVVQKQEIIVVSGINGAGKSTVTANFSKTLSSKTHSRVLVIDLDTLSGNIDEILRIDKVPQNVEMILDENKKCGLNYAVELISKNRFDVNVFEELIINTGEVDVLTGNTSLHYCQNVLNESHYNKILECAKEIYDFIVIDTSSNIFLDSTRWAMQQASRIFFVIENNYISIKKADQFIDIITNLWGIWKNKLNIVINKEILNGIEVEVIRKIFDGYDVIGKIRMGEERQELSYSKILEKINYIPKTSFLDKIFSRKYQDIIPFRRFSVRGERKKEGGVFANVN